MNRTDITVTKTSLPPLDEYVTYLEAIWARGWVTNHGPLVGELEERLRTALASEYVLFVANGTLALQIAIRALGLRGEVITTPFSYVATTSSLIWEDCTPVMADIDQDTLTIDPDRIEAAVTDRTTGILATHVYGIPCDVERIGQIAARHGLKVIYDAAHAFGSQYDGRSVFSYGDVSTASFHATKVFHTVEGGAVCSNSPEVARKAALLRNFGHTGPNAFALPGINGKNSELHAAMGLCNLGSVETHLQLRRAIVARYDRNLAGLPLRRPSIPDHMTWNFAYYPLVFASEAALCRVVTLLNEQGVYPRRYFYPSLATLSFVERRWATPIADDVAPRVLCLPLYTALVSDQVDRICGLVGRGLQV
ncbi:MAG: DegT/DnrJ/EryC1/StrS family aminotransferase [Thermomicrobiales bacterium]|nr:DegT/DnrJ/EryC1/StrS family aminotransferase [Thermomicrobiales bacterium]